MTVGLEAWSLEPVVALVRRLLIVALAGAAWTSTASAQTQDDLFDDTRLHDVHLRINEDDWAALRLNVFDDSYYPADLAWNGITVRNVGLRQRGFGSRTSAKPNIRVDVNRYASNQRLVGLAAINLDNVVAEASSFAIRMAADLHAAGRTRPPGSPARLFVNDLHRRH